MKRLVVFVAILAISSGISILAIEQEARSGIYHFKIENRASLLERLRAAEEERRALLLKQLEAYNESLKPQNRVGEGIQMGVQPNVVLQKAPDGRDELNLDLEFSYQTVSMEEMQFKVSRNTDDYPAGAYLPTQSKACKTVLAFIKNKVDNELAEYFTKGTDVTITITGITDGTPIRNAIPYKGEYGDIENRMIYLNDDIDEITVTKKNGITSNAQLAFLRTQGVQKYLETYVDNLQRTNNRFQIYAVEHKEKGSQFRKVSVKFTIHKAFNNQLAQATNAPVEEPDKKSDVDINIPSTNSSNANTYVVILANEKYNEIVGVVPFAHNDGEIFREYCIRTLGVPSRQIHMFKDATRNQFEDAIDWLKGISGVRSDARFIVYYAGHGVPNGEETYLLPVDANPEKPQQMWSLKEMYTTLSEMPCSSAICLLDACFSGTRRNGEPLTQGGRGVRVSERPKDPVHGNLVVLSAADAKQTAYPFADEKHGLFTYFLLKCLQESNGTVNIDNLFQQISTKVSLEAAMATRQQTPCIQVSEDLADTWKTWTLK